MHIHGSLEQNQIYNDTGAMSRFNHRTRNIHFSSQRSRLSLERAHSSIINRRCVSY